MERNAKEENIQNEDNQYGNNNKKEISSSLSIESQIRNALKLSQIAANSPTNDAIDSAQAAIVAWEALLLAKENPSSIPAYLPSNVKSIGYIFYGHALSQCGRDILAERAFEKGIQIYKLDMMKNDQEPLKKERIQSLKEIHVQWNPTWYEAGVARGRALQRLQRYQEARDQFNERLCLLRNEQKTKIGYGNENDQMNDALATVQNVVSAVTCSFRIDDTIYAKTLLEKYIGIIPINNELLKESQKK